MPTSDKNHFVLNIPARIPKDQAEMVLVLIRTIRAQPDPAAVHEQFDGVATKVAPGFPAVAAVLVAAREDAIACAAFPLAHWKKIWSTNPLSRRMTRR
ncbi:MAG: transposase [Chloroflexota bacterium]